MRFIETGLKDAWLIQPTLNRDERGSFTRTFCEREFAGHGLEARFAQHSVSHSAAKGTLRGMHFQHAPHQEVKLVNCVRGVIYDVIVDLRPGSASFLQWYGAELSAENRHQMYVPKGFAHGFQTLTNDAEVAYRISEFYEPASAAGYRHNDPAFGIAWPLPVSSISEKDRNWPDFPGHAASSGSGRLKEPARP